MIKSGSNVNSQDNMGCTPSHTAVRNGHLSLVELIDDSGADMDMRDKSEKTPFDLAQEYRKLDITGFLAKRSGNLCSLDIVSSATSKAGSRDSLPDDIVEQNIGGGKLSDDEESDSLHNASVNGRIDVVQRLLDRGADLNERNKILQTPLDVASEHGKLAIAKKLIKYGADVNSRDTLGWTPLHVAARHEHIDVVELLLNNGADIHATEREGYTALHIASSWGYPEIVRLLLERGANTQIRNVYGRTPSQGALISGHQGVAQLLSEKDVGGV